LACPVLIGFNIPKGNAKALRVIRTIIEELIWLNEFGSLEEARENIKRGKMLHRPLQIETLKSVHKDTVLHIFCSIVYSYPGYYVLAGKRLWIDKKKSKC
jgi:hypothetical protein